MKRGFCVIDTSMFPLRELSSKWPVIAQRLLLREHELVSPRSVRKDELLLCHEESFVRRFYDGKLSELEMRRIGIPFSSALCARVDAVTGILLMKEGFFLS